MPYRTKALEILDEWRLVERLHEAAIAPEDRLRLMAEMDRLRAAYQSVIAEAQAAMKPEPPPFPGVFEAERAGS